MTDDMMVGQSAEDVSNAIIGAALESGKTQGEISAAMGGSDPAPPAEAAAETADSSASEKKQKLTEVKVEVLKEGNGKKCVDSQIATMEYTGVLYQDQSKVFDSNVGGEGFQFTIGGYTVIKCWQTAIMQMTVGEKANIYCPAKTAYGHQSPSEKIPADSDLMFTVTAQKCEDMF